MSVRMLACAAGIMPFLFVSGAFAENFHDLAGRSGCDSVIDARRSECVSLNAAKENACKVQGGCDLDTHIKQIAEYRTARERLEKGEIAEADRETFHASIERMRAELDARKSEADIHERAARECADARQAVHDFFDDDVIPDTDRARRDANARREELVEALDNAEALQRAAKDRRDQLAGASPETDRARYDEYVKMQEEYEKQAAAYREAEAKLGEFNDLYGKDIDSSVDKLIAYYKSEQDGHRTQIEEQKTRSENCGKLEYMSY